MRLRAGLLGFASILLGVAIASTMGPGIAWAQARDGSASSSPPPATTATVVASATIGAVMGRKVRSRDGADDLGRIVDVLVDGGGAVRAAVIDFGGFLGMGSRKVAVAWGTLDFTHAGETGSIEVTLLRDQIRQSPEYKADEPVVILEGSAPAKPPVAKPDLAKPDPAKPDPAEHPLTAPAPAPAAPPRDHNRDAPAR